MNELKNCPFCGCHAEISETRLNLSAIVLYTVSCINKKTCFHTDFSSFTKETAVKYWNTRAAEDAKDREIERLNNELGIQNNLTRQACFEANRAYDEVEKWKKMFYDLFDKQASISTDPKVIVTTPDTGKMEG